MTATLGLEKARATGMSAEQRIAGRMRAARERASLSQEGAARRLDVSMRTYARWERCESRGFIGHLAQIAAALGTSESDLLGGENPMAATTVADLTAKLDQVMEELRALRREVGDEPGE